MAIAISLSLFVGCHNQPKTPKKDTNGDIPSQIVLRALAAATNGHYDEANRYATPAFSKREAEFRNSENIALQMGAWPARVLGVENPDTDLEFLPAEIHPDGYVIVPVRTPTAKENTYDIYHCIMSNGQWKIGLDDSPPGEPVFVK